MRTIIGPVLLALSLTGLSAGTEQEMTREEAANRVARVLLVGASIGEGWDFPGLPDRTGIDRFRCAYLGLYQFDKTPLLEEAFGDSQGSPDILILKECAAYFPGDLDRYEDLVREWTKRCRETGVDLVLTTVIPVAPKRGFVLRVKAWTKRLLSGRPGRNEQIVAYNDWLKEYAREERLELLDFEATLRESESNRCLRRDLDGGDGLHVNQQAYRLLDRITADLLRRMVSRKD